MIEIAEKTECVFQLKGGLFTITVLQLQDCSMASFKEQLNHTLQQAPKFFQHAPIVIDCNGLKSSEHKFALQDVVATLREFNLIPFGIRGGDNSVQESAKALGMAILHNTSQTLSSQNDDSQKQLNEPSKPKVEESNENSHKTKLITQPVRSGQQIYAKNSDLIILSSVSHGAEILADGNIHVYGILRGRALAGIMGDTEARIFCKTLDAELISIAGRYLVNEQLDDFKEQCDLHIHLEGDHLKISTIA